jgi:hypothetical protein
MSEKSTTPSREAQKQARHRQGVARRLDQIEDHLAELPEIRQQLAALVSLLAVELGPSQEHRR